MNTFSVLSIGNNLLPILQQMLMHGNASMCMGSAVYKGSSMYH